MNYDISKIQVISVEKMCPIATSRFTTLDE